MDTGVQRVKYLIFTLDTINEVYKMPNDNLRFLKIKWIIKLILKRKKWIHFKTLRELGKLSN